MAIPTLVPSMVTAFIVTIAVMLALHPLAKKIGLVDKPGGRKRHLGEIPTIGGIAMFIGMAVGVYLLGPPLIGFIGALVAGLLLISVGVIDDGISLPPATRLLAQLAAVLIMIYGSGLQLSNIGDPFGTGAILTGKFAIIFTLAVTLTMVNAYNLVDGLDGLAGTLALIAMLSIAVVAGIDSMFGAVALTAVASIVGFLLFNIPVLWNRRIRSFMGDAGSTLLGFSVVLVTLGIAQGEAAIISPVHCLWFAAVPIFDCLACFVKRVRKGKSPFAPGQDHSHHILLRGGLSVRAAVGVLIGMQLVSSIIGVSGHFAAVPDVLMFTVWSSFGISYRFIVYRIATTNRLRLLGGVQRRRLATQS